MKNTVYIDGNFLLESGIFYTLDIHDGVGKKNKNIFDDVILCNKDGYYEVKEDGGSMFSTYYVKGGITMYGENGSTIACFKKEHEQTYAKYKEIQSKILQLLEEAIIPEDCKNYFYQQQYISLFANLEYFLYGTFMWETCQSYERYERALRIIKKYVRKEDIQTKRILNRKHCIKQEIVFIKQIKHIVYHNSNKVKDIYKAVFNIDVNLNNLKNEIHIRHDIVHRSGYTTEGFNIVITKEDVLALNDKIDKLVEDITLKINQRKR